MKLLIEGTEYLDVHISKENMNFLKYEKLEEHFFDIYNLSLKRDSLIVEKKDTYKDLPVIHMKINVDGVDYENVPFALIKEGKTSFNPKTINPSFEIAEAEKEVIFTPETGEVILENHKIVNLVKEESENKLDKSEIVNIIQKEAKEGVINDIIKDNFYSILDNSNDSKVVKFFNTYTESFKRSFIDIAEKIARREGLRAMESGGGTNAYQYAHGGVMQGNLTIVGTISATNGIAVETSTISKQAHLIGNGSDTTYTITHNLSSLDVLISVYDAFSNELVYPAGRALDTSSIEISFNNPIPTNSYKVIIVA